MQLWEIATGRRAAVLEIPDQTHAFLERATFSPNAQRLAAIDRSTSSAHVWDTSTGRLISTTGKEGRVSSTASPEFSPDASRLALASDDHTVKIWHVESGKLVVSFKGHTDAVTDISFSADGRTVLTASADGTARLWSVGSKEVAVPLNGLVNNVGAAKLSRDGERVIARSLEPGMAGVWDGRTGRLLLSLPEQTRGVAISSDGRRALTIEQESGARVWDVDSGQLISTLHTAEPTVAILNASGSHAILWGVNSMQLWGIDGGRLEALGRPQPGRLPVLFSPDGRRFLMPSGDGSALLRSVEDRKSILTLRGYPELRRGEAFDATSSRIIAVSNEGRAITWLLDRAAVQSSIKFDVPVAAYHSLIFGDDLKFALSMRGEALQIMDVKRGIAIARVALIAQHSGLVRKGSISGSPELMRRPLVYDMAFGNDNRSVIAVGSDGLVHFIDLGLLAEPDPTVTLRTVCEQRLIGFNKITAADIEVAPVLERLEGQDVCAHDFKL